MVFQHVTTIQGYVDHCIHGTYYIFVVLMQQYV